jgi:biopolymer transport protein ExbD
MRRFSQRGHMVTLSEINITPLLDLAFVLLIIFIITTPLLEQSLNVKLPTGGNTRTKVAPRDVATVEVASNGGYKLDGHKVSDDKGLSRELTDAFRRNQNLVVRIRIDRSQPVQRLTSVYDILEHCGITKVSLATEPTGNR